MGLNSPHGSPVSVSVCSHHILQTLNLEIKTFYDFFFFDTYLEKAIQSVNQMFRLIRNCSWVLSGKWFHKDGGKKSHQRAEVMADFTFVTAVESFWEVTFWFILAPTWNSSFPYFKWGFGGWLSFSEGSLIGNYFLLWLFIPSPVMPLGVISWWMRGALTQRNHQEV